MTDLDLMRSLTQEGDSKIVLLVMDGLGGLPREPGGPTELEAANTPNMDRLAREGAVAHKLTDAIALGGDAQPCTLLVPTHKATSKAGRPGVP